MAFCQIQWTSGASGWSFSGLHWFPQSLCKVREVSPNWMKSLTSTNLQNTNETIGLTNVFAVPRTSKQTFPVKDVKLIDFHPFPGLFLATGGIPPNPANFRGQWVRFQWLASSFTIIVQGSCSSIRFSQINDFHPPPKHQWNHRFNQRFWGATHCKVDMSSKMCETHRLPPISRIILGNRWHSAQSSELPEQMVEV